MNTVTTDQTQTSFRCDDADCITGWSYKVLGQNSDLDHDGSVGRKVAYGHRVHGAIVVHRNRRRCLTLHARSRVQRRLIHDLVLFTELEVVPVLALRRKLDLHVHHTRNNQPTGECDFCGRKRKLLETEM